MFEAAGMKPEDVETVTVPKCNVVVMTVELVIATEIVRVSVF